LLAIVFWLQNVGPCGIQAQDSKLAALLLACQVEKTVRILRIASSVVFVSCLICIYLSWPNPANGIKTILLIGRIKELN
jgi:hypothetical protein